MKTKFFLFLISAAVLSVGFAACSDSDDDVTDPNPNPEPPGVVTSDTVHLAFKGDTVNLAEAVTPFFASELNANSSAAFSFSLISQPEKREVGFGTNGEWAALENIYQITPDGSNIVAADGLPASWNLPDITDKYRELKPAVLQAKLTANGQDVATRQFFVVQDSVVREIIKIEAPEKTNINAASYAASNGVFTWVVNSSTTFSGASIRLFYSDGKSGTGAAGFTFDEDFNIIYLYQIAIDAVNENGSSTAGGSNVGSPISQGTAVYSYYINRPTSVPANAVGANGYFDIYPYGTSTSDWRAVHLAVKPVTFTGIIQRPDNSYIEYAGATRCFRREAQDLLQGNFFAFETVSEGPSRPYQNTDNGGTQLLIVAGSWNSYNGSPVIEGYVASANDRSNSLLKPGSISGSEEQADYAAFYRVRLTADSKEAPVGTPVTFKICPKDHFDAQGNPDPAYTLDISTQVYEKKVTP
jgi:hypothetical protein